MNIIDTFMLGLISNCTFIFFLLISLFYFKSDSSIFFQKFMRMTSFQIFKFLNISSPYFMGCHIDIIYYPEYKITNK